MAGHNPAAVTSSLGQLSSAAERAQSYVFKNETRTQLAIINWL